MDININYYIFWKIFKKGKWKIKRVRMNETLKQKETHIKH